MDFNLKTLKEYAVPIAVFVLSTIISNEIADANTDKEITVIKPFIGEGLYNNIATHKEFEELCNNIFLEKYALYSNNITEKDNKSTCKFHKNFEQNFFKKIFGPKSILFVVEFEVTYSKDSTSGNRNTYFYKSQWSELHSNDKSKDVSGEKYSELLNAQLLYNDVIHWHGTLKSQEK